MKSYSYRMLLYLLTVIALLIWDTAVKGPYAVTASCWIVIGVIIGEIIKKKE